MDSPPAREHPAHGSHLDDLKPETNTGSFRVCASQGLRERSAKNARAGCEVKRHNCLLRAGSKASWAEPLADLRLCMQPVPLGEALAAHPTQRVQLQGLQGIHLVCVEIAGRVKLISPCRCAEVRAWRSPPLDQCSGHPFFKKVLRTAMD